MAFIQIGVTIFIIVFGLFFYFTYRNEKQHEKHAFSISLLVSFVFGLIITVVILFFTLIFAGATNMISDSFNLSLNLRQIIYLAVCYLLYVLIFEKILLNFFLYLVGYGKVKYLLVLTILRFLVLFSIGSFFAIPQNTNIIITIAMTIFLYMFDSAADQLKGNADESHHT